MGVRPQPPLRLGPDYRKVWLASAVFNLGDGVTVAAAPLLAVTLTRDPVLVSGLSVAVHLAWLVFGLVSGALVDRWDRRRLMVAVDVLRAAVVSALALAVAADRGALWLLYAAVFLLGAGETLFDVASQALLPRLVPGSLLERANARLFAVQTIANGFVGKPVGGLLFAAAPALPFAVDAVSFLGAALLLAAVRATHPLPAPDAPRMPRAGRGPTRSLLRDIGDGVAWVWRNRPLRDIGLLTALMNFAATAAWPVAVLLAQERFGVGESGFGLLLAASAAGSVAGGLLADRASARLGARRTLTAAVLLSSAAFALVAVARDPVVAGAAFGLSGLCGVTYNTTIYATRQRLAPDRLLRRVIAAHRLLAWGAIPAGALCGGLLARRWGLTAPWWFAAAAFAAVAWASHRVLRVEEARPART